MAIALILDFPDGSIEKYDAVIDGMDLGGRLPPGSLFHASGPAPAGGLRVIDVWESDEAFQAFADAAIMPGVTRVGLSPPQVTRIDAKVRDGGTPRSAIGFVHVARLPLDAEAFGRMYDELMGHDELPEGMLYHVNGPAPDGTGWIVVGGWPSRDARDRFLAERVIPTAQRMGMGPPAVEDLEVHNVLEPAEVRAAR
jgi:hypothetical protein